MKSLFAYIIFLISLAILVSLSILYTQRFRELTRYTNKVENTYRVLIELNKLFGYLKDAETGSRGFLLSNDSSFLQPYAVALDSIKPSLQKVYQLAAEHPEIVPRIDELNILIYERLDIMNHSMLLYQQSQDDFIQVLRRGKEKMDECRNLIQQVNQETYSDLDQSQKSKAFYELVTPGFFLIIMGFTAIAFVISFYVILREYTGRLRHQKNLEKKIIALNTSYKELEQIAYISSHDLQEPLRKISIFCDRLSMKYASDFDEEGKHIIERIHQSSTRTRELVDILSNYTSLIAGDKKKETIDLKNNIHAVGEKFKELLKEKNTTLEITGLSTVKGYRDQIQLLFECLIDNSIKFSKRDTALKISISRGQLEKSEMDSAKSLTAQNAFLKIIYTDNGVGFDNTFSEKIFSIFQRLNVEVDGKGVGLAIVRRVMSNHDGFVVADGVVNGGAKFFLYFPEEDE